MNITPINYKDFNSNKVNDKCVKSKIAFKKLLPNDAKIKQAVFDIDETLINWPGTSENIAQTFRNKLFGHLKQNKIISVLSSDRGYDGIIQLFAERKLDKTNFISANNGGFIYQLAPNGNFKEISEYSDKIRSEFNKNKVREIIAEIANKPENMFSAEEWAKVPSECIPKGQKDFRGSKITEYLCQESPYSIRFCLAPGMYVANIDKINAELKRQKIKSYISFFHYPATSITKDGLRKYITPSFTEESLIDLTNHYLPRTYPDGSGDALLISGTEKGNASEYIRNKLGLEKDMVFATGDAENDFSNTNKGYFFGLIANASKGLKNLISHNDLHNTKIVESSKPGGEGIVDILI